MNNSNITIKWPIKLKVSGIPFGPCYGWNSIFHITNKTYNNYPIYQLRSYNLYHIIKIYGATILNYDGKWILNNENNPIDGFSICESENNKKYPWGNWKYNIKIEAII